ncbi:MAG: AAA family ATPase [archaeon]
MGKIVGVVSLKGGVGKTSSVVALGSAIASFDKKVLLIDGDFSAPNLGLHLNIIDPETTIHHVLSKRANVKEAIHKLDNFDVIPASVFERIEINPFALRDKIKPLKRKYDVVIVDSSPSLNEETLAVMLASDEILVVTTPDFPTLSTTLKAVKLAKQRGTLVSGLVLNKVYNKNFELSVGDIEKTSDVPVMAVIPYDINVLRAQSEFIPSTAHRPKSKASEEYKRLGAALIGEKYKPVKMKNFLRWINPEKQYVNREIYYKSVFG